MKRWLALTVAVLTVALAWAAARLRAPHPREHELLATPQTVHWGFYSAALPPVLMVDSGDEVIIEDVPRIAPEVLQTSRHVPPAALSESYRAIWREVKDRVGPHILVGPVYVRGAEPGDTLEVQLVDVQLAIPFGYNFQEPREGVLADETGAPWLRVAPIDLARREALIAPGVHVPVEHPFFGNLGVAPASAERVDSVAPGLHGGNLDDKELVAGTTLYLPVQVRGALFSAGDAHAAQGDGEVDLTALETAARGRFRLTVRKGPRLTAPRAETPEHWIVYGLAESLDEALRAATREAIACILEQAPWLSREEAYMIASVGVDFRIAQAVNGTRTVRGVIPKRLFARR